MMAYNNGVLRRDTCFDLAHPAIRISLLGIGGIIPTAPIRKISRSDIVIVLIINCLILRLGNLIFR